MKQIYCPVKDTAPLIPSPVLSLHWAGTPCLIPVPVLTFSRNSGCSASSKSRSPHWSGEGQSEWSWKERSCKISKQYSHVCKYRKSNFRRNISDLHFDFSFLYHPLIQSQNQAV